MILCLNVASVMWDVQDLWFLLMRPAEVCNEGGCMRQHVRELVWYLWERQQNPMMLQMGMALALSVPWPA